MPLFTKKPVMIEAVQWTGENCAEISNFACDSIPAVVFGKPLTVITLEGQHTASVNDWIIRGVKGEFYPCKPDIFDMTYDRACMRDLNEEWAQLSAELKGTQARLDASDELLREEFALRQDAIPFLSHEQRQEYQAQRKFNK